MKLILTEKPDVANAFAKALNITNKLDGYYKNNEYLISWAIGHLMTIDNSILPKEWKFENLPIIPETFNYEVIKEKAKQYHVIKKLLPEVTQLIIATDAGREGELIARLILNKLGWKNWDNTQRFWTSEPPTDPKIILKNLAVLKPSKNYDGYYYSGIARNQADWLCGMNLTMAITCKNHNNLLTVGRVQTPALRLIVDRDLEILNFKSERYYVLKAQFSSDGMAYIGYYFQDKNTPALTNDDEESEKEVDTKLSKEAARNIIDSLFLLKTGKVVSLKKESKQETPPHLYSITDLYIDASNEFNYSPTKTLELTQSLYETHKCVSYPRSESNYLSESSHDLVKEIFNYLDLTSLTPKITTVGKRVFDDSKLTDHHAIIPLNVVPDSATEDEKNIYALILRRFKGAFYPNFEYDVTTVVTKLGDHLFKTTGKVVVLAGWKALYNNNASTQKDVLPPVAEGLEVNKDKVDVMEKDTKPKDHYTDSTFIAKLRKLGLGTGATINTVSETLLKRVYIIKNKKYLVSTDKGKELISKVRERDFCSPELTANWETKLEAIEKKKLGINGYNEFISGIKVFVKTEVLHVGGLELKTSSQATPKMISFAKELAKSHKVKLESTTFEYIKEFLEKYKEAELGKCSCGQIIKDGPKAWSCVCGKIVWKEQFKKKITLKQALDLMNNKTITLTGLTSPKNQQKFDAQAKLNVGKLELSFGK